MINSKCKIKTCDNFFKSSTTFHLIGCYNNTLTCDFRETATISGKAKHHLIVSSRSQTRAACRMTVKR